MLLAAGLAGCMGTEPDKPKPVLQALSAKGSDFSQTRIGTRKQLDFELRNSDDSFVSVEALRDIAISVSGAGVSMTETCPTSLEEGESCLISVIYQPSDLGTLDGQLRIASNAEEGTLLLGLSGSAVTVLNPASGAVAQTGELSTDFSTTVGKSVSKTYTVKNLGNAIDTLTITGPGSSDTGWTFQNNCSTTLAAGATCTLDLSFLPTASGSSVPTPITVTDDYNKDYGKLVVRPVGIAN
jgi:hypothetical protein